MKDNKPFYHRPVIFIQRTLGLEPGFGNKVYNDGAILIFIFVFLWVVGRFTFGAFNANNPRYCRMKSIGDFLIAPSYTIGCNIGKDRWDIRVN